MSRSAADMAALRDESAEDRSECRSAKRKPDVHHARRQRRMRRERRWPLDGHHDLVKYYGGDPANFLISAAPQSGESRFAAVRIITADPNVKAILFKSSANTHGLMTYANGIVTRDKGESSHSADCHPAHRDKRRDCCEDPRGDRIRGDDRMDEAVKKASPLATGKKAAEHIHR